jgi:hypothetical protein
MKTAAFGLASWTPSPSPKAPHHRRPRGGAGDSPATSTKPRSRQAARHALNPRYSSTVAPTTRSTR